MPEKLEIGDETLSTIYYLFKLQIRCQKRFSIEFDSSSQFGNKKFERFYSF